ncbi:heavy metal translocating P-type ATPase [Pseudoflavonifractor capillosus]|uniref:heavy metal translocating P-type ATPase n=1 Tax=Pseudoflavonifractor capillosus TaxID=106588 RepID=UPI0019565642|nr:heavy metal translocating P-type ATPase [Pseudoflavonifractor capillosus]MBM6680791.1 cadmium-translocating P-type ATPase [Pseudoflavonifractor capillosus]
MTKKQKKTRKRILTALGLFLALELAEHLAPDALPGLAWPVLYLIPYGIIGWDVLWRAIRNIKNGQVFDENFLMSVATVGAFGCGEYPEAVAVMLFYQVGELFQSVAVDRSRKSISALMDIRPDYANIEQNGELVQVDPEEVSVGDVIVVKAGERVPLDGTVLEGTSSLDTAALTGESLPRDVQAGDEVVSGCVNLTGVLHVKVNKPFGESTVAKILDLVENSSSKKAKAENFITKFARYYTPAVVFAALALAALPPLLGMGPWLMWVQRALNFLVVSCPCALVISIPLSFFGGIGGASKQGILVKGGNYLEALAQAGIVVFDKTGTLTRGTFEVTAVHPQQVGEGELLELAALAERFSDHPISRSIQAACQSAPDPNRVTDAKEIAGHGVQAVVDGKTVLAGNQKLMDQFHIPFEDACHHVGTIIHVAVDGVYMGHIVISDQVKEGAKETLRDLKAAGVRKTVMLTGDSQAVGQAVAGQLGLDEVHAELLPGDKVDQVERLLQSKGPKEQLVFVGDGINDAPVLSRADIGVAMGAMGSDAAIEAADIVLMDDDLKKLPVAVRIARKTLRIVRENIVFALAVKFLVLILSALGVANMWWAVFADVGVSVIAILNSMRMLNAK